jgi:hypothetical protein
MTDYKTNINIILGGSPADKLKEVYKPVLTDTECSTNIGGAFDPLYMISCYYLDFTYFGFECKNIVFTKLDIYVFIISDAGNDLTSQRNL